MRKLPWQLALALVFLVAAVLLHVKMASHHLDYSKQYRSYYIPSSATMKVVSLGERNFLADLLFTWTVQYYDFYARGVRAPYLNHTLDVITDLDRRYTDAYIFGNLFFSLQGRWDLLYAFSNKGIAANPQDWNVAWDAATHAFFGERNYEKALYYFNIERARDSSPQLADRFIALSTWLKGDLDTSLAYLKKAVEENENNPEGSSQLLVFSARRQIHDLTISIDVRNLKAALAKYQQKHGSFPPDLSNLVKEGLIREVPLDPADKQYLYNSQTGEVVSQSPFQYRGKYARW